jgi:hypothetical protein
MSRRLTAIALSLALLLSGVYTAVLLSPRAHAQSTYAPFQCTVDTPIASAAAGQLQLVTAGNANMFIYICALSLGTGGTAGTGSIVEGTGTTCQTNTAAVIGGTTASPGLPIGSSPVQTGSGIGYVAKTKVAGDNICLYSATATNFAGVIATGQQPY